MEADRDRMKSLLVEAIATLCRNGLKYKEELSVEGLIGITVDKKDVFLVSVKETFNITPKEITDTTKVRAESDAESSQKGDRRSAKRRGESSSGKGPPEKHKRKGAPKQITGDEIELINNSPVPEEDSNEESIDQNSLSSAGDASNQTPLKNAHPIVIEDTDLLIKKEMVKSDSAEGSSAPFIYEAGDRQVSPNSGEDPRSRHPAGIDQEQMGLILAEEIKHIKPEQDSDADISVFNTPSGEVIRVPRSLAASNTQGQDGMGDFSGVPVEWAGPSTSQDFAQLSGDDQSLLESPSQQASGSAGASQQGAEMTWQGAEMTWLKLETDELFSCNLCDKKYKYSRHLTQHTRENHMNICFPCSMCSYQSKRRYDLERHITRKHKRTDM